MIDPSSCALIAGEAAERFGLDPEQAEILASCLAEAKVSAVDALKLVPDKAFVNPGRTARFINELAEYLGYFGVVFGGGGHRPNPRGNNGGGAPTNPSCADHGAFDYWPPGIPRSQFNKVRNPKRVNEAELVVCAEPERVASVFDDFAEFKFEKKVGKEIELALYLEEIKPVRVLSREEERDIAIKAAQGDLVARNMLVVHNLKFAAMIAKKFIGRCSSLDYMDLIQLANLGLIIATRKFEPERNLKFLTYAGWWVKAVIFREIDSQSKFCRLPVHVGEKIRKVEKVISQYEKEFQMMPTMGEISEASGMPLQEVIGILDVMSRSLEYFDEQVGDSSRCHGDYIAYPSAQSADDIMAMSEELDLFSVLVHKILCSLPASGNRKKYIAIFRCRYGLDGTGDEKTLDETGKKFGITRERVRQVCQIVWKSAYSNAELDKKAPFERIDAWFRAKLIQMKQYEIYTDRDFFANLDLRG